MRRETLYYVRDNARKKDPRVMATLKYMAKRDPNINIKMTAAELLIHVGMQTLPEQIWCCWRAAGVLLLCCTHIPTHTHALPFHTLVRSID